MRHARRAPAPPGDVPAHRASPQFKPRAGVLTRGRTRGHDDADLIEVRDRSSVSSAAARLPPALAPARSAFHSFRASFSLTPLTARAPPQTKDGKGDKAEAVEPVAELPDAEEESVALVDTKVLEEEEARGTEEEGGGCQPADGARPAPRLFRPIPPRVGRGHVAGAGATQFRCPRHHARRSRRPRRLSRAPRRPRVTMRAIARARAVDDARARPRAPPPQISHPQIAELFQSPPGGAPSPGQLDPEIARA